MNSEAPKGKLLVTCDNLKIRIYFKAFIVFMSSALALPLIFNPMKHSEVLFVSGAFFALGLFFIYLWNKTSSWFQLDEENKNILTCEKCGSKIRHNVLGNRKDFKAVTVDAKGNLPIFGPFHIMTYNYVVVLITAEGKTIIISTPDDFESTTRLAKDIAREIKLRMIPGKEMHKLFVDQLNNKLAIKFEPITTAVKIRDSFEITAVRIICLIIFLLILGVTWVLIEHFSMR